MTEEDTEMNVAWHRVLVATAFVVTLVALGALEVLTARLPVDQAVTGPMGRADEPTGSSQGSLNGQGQLLSLEYGPALAGEASESRRVDERLMEARGGQFLR